MVVNEPVNLTRFHTLNNLPTFMPKNRVRQAPQGQTKAKGKKLLVFLPAAPRTPSQGS
jgi:hypothetical protein